MNQYMNNIITIQNIIIVGSKSIISIIPVLFILYEFGQLVYLGYTLVRTYIG